MRKKGYCISSRYKDKRESSKRSVILFWYRDDIVPLCFLFLSAIVAIIFIWTLLDILIPSNVSYANSEIYSDYSIESKQVIYNNDDETVNNTVENSEDTLTDLQIVIDYDDLTRYDGVSYLLAGGVPRILNGQVTELDTIESEIETERQMVIPCTEEERLVCQYIVEMEAHELSYKHKQRIMCVIVNRMYSDLFPDQNSLLEVTTAPDQFSSLYNFYNPVYYPDEETVKAVDSILYGDEDLYDVSLGALFFYNPDRSGGYIDFFESREFLYEMDGHRFFA